MRSAPGANVEGVTKKRVISNGAQKMKISLSKTRKYFFLLLPFFLSYLLFFLPFIFFLKAIFLVLTENNLKKAGL